MSIQSYADLKGGEDRGIFYRSERFRARDLMGPTPPPVDIGGGSFALHDLSTSGLAIQAPANDGRFDVGSRIDFTVGAGDAVLYQGRGEVVRLEPGRRGLKIGIRIVDGHLDVGELVASHRHHALRQELDEAPVAQQLFVTPEYRRFCSDLVFMLRRYRSALERYEREAEGGGERARQRLQEAFELCAPRFEREFRELWREGYAVIRPQLGDRRAVAAMKRFTEMVVTPELVAGPIWRRSYEKPLGYPGDYQVMNYVYDGGDRGEGAYARLCHRVGVEVGMCVRTRMEMVAEEIAALLSAEGGPCAVTSLGCGSAVEVTRGLAAAERAEPRPVAFTLIDQDQQALDCAYRNSFPLINADGRQARLNCLHLSFGQLLSGGLDLGRMNRQDLVYCAGLLDYLPELQAQTVVAGLYSLLKPGGLLIIGNMKAGTDNAWALGMVLDWELIYRDEAQMHALAGLIKPAGLELKVDRTGYNYMLYIRAPK